MNKGNKYIYTVTFHRANNYGAALQAFALQKFLLKRNYKTEILDYDNFKISDHYRIIKKDRSSIFRVAIHIVPRIPKFFSELKKEKNFDVFRKELLQTRYYASKDSLISNPPKCDVAICGSDQIWNPFITNGLDEIYFLQFGDQKMKRISYAASCGSTDKIDDKDKFLTYLKKFNHISVRENELKEYIDSLHYNADVVLDPSLLLNRDEWLEEMPKDRLLKEKYIFTYSVGNGNELYYKTINYLAKKYNLKVIYFDKSCNKIKVNKKCYYSAGPKEFLNLLYNSEFVVTTSFHGFALSTVLNKKMIVVLSTYPDRLVTLAKKIEIDNVFLKDEKDIQKIYDMEIDWEKINKKLKLQREKSCKWLIDSIESE